MFVLYLWEMKIDTITLYEQDLQDAGAWFVKWDWIGKLCYIEFDDPNHNNVNK
jgi:hypothetical protein